MKLLLICSLLFALAFADERPIYEFPEWWKLRDFEPSQWIQSRFRGGRIIGGNEAAAAQFPYQVGLRLFIQNSNNVGLCGGSLISVTRVVSAAHCVDIVSGVEAVFGAHVLNNDQEPNQVRRTVDLPGLIWHENYQPSTLTNDVAIILLPSAVPQNAFIQVINLPDAELTNDFAGELAVASGWGRFSSANVASEFLRFVHVNVMTNTACRIRFPTIIRDSTSKLFVILASAILKPNLLSVCTSGAGTGGANVGACNGDSGGPLTLQRQGQSMLIGIASFVSGVGCESGWPTGFARVTSFVPWFRARM